MQKVIIASLNPVKIQASQNAFQRMFPNKNFEFEGVSVDSNVSDQPKGNNETIQGANNRASGAQKLKPQADYWIGIEGGIEEIENDMTSMAWIIIKSKNQEGKARTATLFLPPAIQTHVKAGKELGEANDLVFNKTNSKQKSGSVGTLTNDVITRTKYYEEAIVLALIPFKNPDLY